VIRVVLADDHALFLEGVAALLKAETGIEVVGQANSADQVVALCLALGPEVAVVDIDMPGGGVRAIETIVRDQPRTRCLALTMHDDPAYLRSVLASGGSGYILKGAASEELILAIHQVAAGHSYVRISVGDEGLRGVASAWEPPPSSRLSVRERQVLAGVARGFTSREIAEQLGLGVKTVETYRTRLYDKLGLSGRAALVEYALRVGLLSPGERPRS
jgi:DNA-binding NarL/FixJ family response regulator